MSILSHTPTSIDQPPAAALLAPEDVVPLRDRCDGWTPARQRSFIEVLADTGCVAAAAAAVDMSEQSAHRLRRRSDAAAFAAAWETALEMALSGLIGTAFARATVGVPRARYFRGERVGEESVPSDRLLIWLIEKGRAQLGRANERKVVAANWDGALDAIGDAEAPIGGYRVWMGPDGHPLTNLPPDDDFDFDSPQKGTPGAPGYERELTDVESDAWFEQIDFGPYQAARARLFPGIDEEYENALRKNALRSG